MVLKLQFKVKKKNYKINIVAQGLFAFSAINNRRVKM